MHGWGGMRSRYLAIGVLAALPLVACGVLADDASTQESAHTEGEPTFAQHPWLWADESEEEFRRNAVDNSSSWMGRAEFLPLDHPMTQRLQFWVDRMDEVLRTAYPEKLRATPKPVLIVRKSETANAWVSGIPITWAVPTQLAGGAPAAVDAGDPDGGEAGAPAEPAAAGALMLSRNGTVRVAEVTTTFDRAFSREALGELASFYNKGFSKCRLDARGGEQLLFSEACASPRGVSQRRGARLTYYATGKHVTFTTGYIMQLLDEDRVISTLAHELGHYYRSHSNVPTDVVNYFYSLDEAHAHKPPPDPRYIEQTARAREKLRDRGTWTEENALMREQHLGFYTTEQEADEIALELMAKIGVPPGVAVDKVLNMLKSTEERGGERDPDAIGWAECAMLREHGFRDADGKEVSVPVGDPSNAHHNLCFRAYNMSREINAHRYSVAERPRAPGDPWARLLARLGAEIDPPPPAPPPPPPDAGAPSDAGGD